MARRDYKDSPEHMLLVCIHKVLMKIYLFIKNVLEGTVKPVLSGHSKEDQKYDFDMGNRLIQVKSTANCSKGEHSAIFSICIKLPSVF